MAVNSIHGISVAALAIGAEFSSVVGVVGSVPVLDEGPTT